MAAKLRTAVVLGGARSIGGQCCRAFTAAGWGCFLADSNQRHLNEVVEELGGERFGVYHGDLSSLLGLRNVLAGVLEQFGRVDAVVHIPDLPERGALFDGESGDFEECLVAPARAVTSVYRLFGQQILKQDQLSTEVDPEPQGHSFVTVLGMAAITADEGCYSQSISQSMALAATKSAALDLAKYKIRANAIVAVRPRAETDEPWLKQRTPLGRHSYAEEIADAALFLCGASAANMTGQSMVIDGGRTLLNGIIAQPGAKDIG